MVQLGKTEAGRFCWIDLAASNADSAKSFYAKLFGWTSEEQAANGGTFTRLRHADRDVASLYQLRHRHIEQGLPSHWTPYIRVDDVDETARCALACGGRMIVRPFVVSGMARIALILDSVGAQVGLWEPIPHG